MGGTRAYFFRVIDFLLKHDEHFICYIYKKQADEKILKYLKERSIPFYLSECGFKISQSSRIGRRVKLNNLLILFSAVIKLNRLMKSYKANKIIITTGYNDEYVYMFLLPYKKIIYINHTLAYYEINPINKKILNSCLSSCKVLVGVSKCSLQSMIEYYKIKEKNKKFCKVLFNYSSFKKNKFRQYSNKLSFNITTIGHLEKYKNPLLWLNIAKQVIFENPKYTLNFYWAGEGSMLQACQEEVRYFENIHFLGIVENIPCLLDKTDIYIQTSDIESFGMSALDAMASGIPVLLKNTTGLRELIEYQVSGILFEDLEGGISSLSYMISNYSKLNNMVNAAKMKQEGMYSQKTWEKGLIKLLKD